MKKRSLAFLLALVLACGLMLGGCSSDGSANVGESGSEGDGVADGERVLTIASPYAIGSLTPWISNSDGDRYVLGNVYEALIEVNTGSEDGVEYELHAGDAEFCADGHTHAIRNHTAEAVTFLALIVKDRP